MGEYLLCAHVGRQYDNYEWGMYQFCGHVANMTELYEWVSICRVGM